MKPSSFSRKRKGIAKEAKVQIQALDDYYLLLVNTLAKHQSMIACYKLMGNAKLWQKEWFHEQLVDDH